MRKKLAARFPIALFIIIAASLMCGDTATQARQTQAVKLFFILDEGNGKFGKKVGCNDSVVPVVVKIEPTTSPLKAAFTELLAVKSETYCETGLRNSLSQSSLKVESASIVNKTAIIKLTGEYRDAGHCDTPRVQAQLVETAMQFPGVKKVKILVNGGELKFNPVD
jgi:spore germination protein GerM